MYLRLIMDLLVAFFAVLGFYGMIRWIAQRLFGSRQLMIAIRILTQRDAESAELLIRDALSQYFTLPSARLVVLTTEELFEDRTLVEACRTYGVTRYKVIGKREEVASLMNNEK